MTKDRQEIKQVIRDFVSDVFNGDHKELQNMLAEIYSNDVGRPRTDELIKLIDIEFYITVFTRAKSSHPKFQYNIRVIGDIFKKVSADPEMRKLKLKEFKDKPAKLKNILDHINISPEPNLKKLAVTNVIKQLVEEDNLTIFKIERYKKSQDTMRVSTKELSMEDQLYNLYKKLEREAKNKALWLNWSMDEIHEKIEKLKEN